MGTLGAVVDRIAGSRGPVLTQADVVLLPHRVGEGSELRPVLVDTVRRLEKDLTLVYRNRALELPPGRTFGIDFRRGLKIEWAELAQGIDVERDLFNQYRREILQKLSEYTNVTINLRHEPSAGGTTLSYRLAWSLMEDYPVVVLYQLTGDTASYLGDLFHLCSLPLLVVMESETVAESAREELFHQLIEDGTRAVFVWVSRVYQEDVATSDVLRGQLSDHEAETFLGVYLDQVVDAGRRDQLQRLTYDQSVRDQRAPFFYGLAAFGENYAGLQRLIEETTTRLSSDGRRVLAHLNSPPRFGGM